MADTKISGLPASTTPLAGTEELPIVQSGVTRKVSVANLTAGRALSATQMTLTTGNLVVANGQGIDFSATPGTGTSELFNDYEEGNWSPIIIGSSSAGTGTYSVQVGTYTKIGNSVFVQMFLIWTAHTGTGDMKVGGLPFTTSATLLNFSAASIGQFENIALTIASTPMAIIATSGTTIDLRQMPTGGGAMANVAMDTAGGIILTAAYKV